MSNSLRMLRLPNVVKKMAAYANVLGAHECARHLLRRQFLVSSSGANKISWQALDEPVDEHPHAIADVAVGRVDHVERTIRRLPFSSTGNNLPSAR